MRFHQFGGEGCRYQSKADGLYVSTFSVRKRQFCENHLQFVSSASTTAAGEAGGVGGGADLFSLVEPESAGLNQPFLSSLGFVSHNQLYSASLL